MFHFRPSEFAYLAFYLALFSLIVLASFIGDHLLKIPRQSAAVQYGIALADTSIHGFIGTCSWGMFVILQLATIFVSRYCQWTVIRDVILCGLLSSAIDVDHAIAAQSLSIKNLTSLSKRPFFHNTTTLLFFSLMLILLGYNLSQQEMSMLTRLGYILLIATVSHHVRDALRRGLNLWPLLPRPLPPVSLSMYFLFLFLLPLMLHIVTQRSHSFGYGSNRTEPVHHYFALNQDEPVHVETVV